MDIRGMVVEWRGPRESRSLEGYVYGVNGKNR